MLSLASSECVKMLYEVRPTCGCLKLVAVIVSIRMSTPPPPFLVHLISGRSPHCRGWVKFFTAVVHLTEYFAGVVRNPVSKLVSWDLGVPCRGNAGRYVMTLSKSCKARIKHLSTPYIKFACAAYCISLTILAHAHLNSLGEWRLHFYLDTTIPVFQF